MDKKQYQDNYKNIDYVDAKGKVRTDVVYMGKHYMLEKPETYTMFKVSFLLITILITAAFILPLCFKCGLTKQMYFTLPFVVQGFAILVLFFGSYDILAKKQPFNEKVKTMVFTYSKVGCIIGAILTLVSTIGMIVFVTKGQLVKMDIFGAVCSPACMLLYLAQFANVHFTKVVSLNNLQNPEEI